MTKALKGRYSAEARTAPTKPSRGGKSQAGRGLPHRERERQAVAGLSGARLSVVGLSVAGQSASQADLCRTLPSE